MSAAAAAWCTLEMFVHPMSFLLTSAAAFAVFVVCRSEMCPPLGVRTPLASLCIPGSIINHLVVLLCGEYESHFCFFQSNLDSFSPSVKFSFSSNVTLNRIYEKLRLYNGFPSLPLPLPLFISLSFSLFLSLSFSLSLSLSHIIICPFPSLRV
jgi:hypothetical protein